MKSDAVLSSSNIREQFESFSIQTSWEKCTDTKKKKKEEKKEGYRRTIIMKIT